MPTGLEIIADQAWVESQGYKLEILAQDHARADWYRPDGLCIPQLPVDGYSRNLYRGKGWSLQRPTPAEVAAWKEANPEALAKLKPVQETVAPVLPLSREMAKELAEVTRTAIPAPPKHIHVMEDALGAPCLVLGCATTRKFPRTAWRQKSKKG